MDWARVVSDSLPFSQVPNGLDTPSAPASSLDIDCRTESADFQHN